MSSGQPDPDRGFYGAVLSSFTQNVRTGIEYEGGQLSLPRDSQEGVTDGPFVVLAFSVDEIPFTLTWFYEQ